MRRQFSGEAQEAFEALADVLLAAGSEQEQKHAVARTASTLGELRREGRAFVGEEGGTFEDIGDALCGGLSLVARVRAEVESYNRPIGFTETVRRLHDNLADARANLEIGPDADDGARPLFEAQYLTRVLVDALEGR